MAAIIIMTLSFVKFIPQTSSELVISLENIKDQMSYIKFTGALIWSCRISWLHGRSKYNPFPGKRNPLVK